MPISVIPVGDEPRQTLETNLGEVDFVLDLDWSARAGQWLLSVRVGEAALALGIGIVPGVRLLRPRAYRIDVPEGELVVLGDPSGAPPGLADFASGAAALTFVDGVDLAVVAPLP